MALPSERVAEFGQETRTFFGVSAGLPTGPIHRITVGPDGRVYAYGSWGSRVSSPEGTWTAWAKCDDMGPVVPGPDGTPWGGPAAPAGTRAVVGVRRGVAYGADGLAEVQDGRWVPLASVAATGVTAVRDAAALSNGSLVMAAAQGAFLLTPSGQMTELLPRDSTRAWHGWDARAVAVGLDDSVWLALPQGLACRRGSDWTLYEGRDGVPFCDATCCAVAADGVLWVGTTCGAVRFDGQHWAYRQGRRWLPDDAVTAVCVSPDGSAWLATRAGVARLHTEPMTLSRKAAFYEAEIDRWHRRTVLGYVIEGRTAIAGVKETVTLSDSDNDGLWTAMYGAGECFAYAATGAAAARRRAEQAWLALQALGSVTQGGEPAAEPGFVARSVLPAADGDPNQGSYTPAGDVAMQQSRDRLWKQLSPRWPRSANGQWYWKADTSSDELDGHFFFYGRYYDLVARDGEERDQIREHTCALVDHLLRHDFCLVDHDGTPTRWGVFSPRELNLNPDWFAERGLNSLSILSYLATAFHMSGDTRYRDAADTLVCEHGYLQNLLCPKIHNGIGSGNQSDDEMAFMCYFNLIHYTHSEDVRDAAAFSLYRYWRLERPEMNPFFNVVYASCCQGRTYRTAHSAVHLEAPDAEWLEDAVDTLKRFPLDRFNWAHTNSRRDDLVPLHDSSRLAGEGQKGRGCRVNGKVIPVDECFFNHWNYDPWRLDSGGDGTQLADGAVFLLPYYMALYQGVIREV